MKKDRIITALVLATVLGLAIFTNYHIYRGLMLIVLAISAYEIYLLTKDRANLITSALMYLLVVGSTFFDYHLQLVAVNVWLLVLVLISLIIPSLKLHDVLLYYALTVVLIGAMNGALRSYEFSGSRGVLWIVICNFLTDTGAYLVGMKFGKHKLIPAISPNKTIEGAIGGYLIGAIGGLIFAFTADVNHTTGFLVVGSLLIPILAQVGDLFFSLIKRYYKVKDFSNFLPGHGGILDRIDSALISFFVVNILIVLWSVLIWGRL